MGTLSDLKKLWTVAEEFQAASDAIMRLKPVRWLETDEQALRHISGQITAKRLEQRRILAANDVISLLNRLEASDPARTSGSPPGPRDRALIRAMRRFCNTLLPLSENDIKAMDQVTAQSETEWLETFEIAESQGTRAAFAEQAKTLRSVFGLRRALSRKVADVTGLRPSEVPLDEFNPWMRNKDIDDLFASAVKVWPKLVASLRATTHNQPAPANPFNSAEIRQKFSSQNQLSFFKKIRTAMLEAAGWTEGELKKHHIVLHEPKFQPNPFCAGTRSEIWMTIENRNGDFFIGLGNTLHETGHLLYLLSLNRLDPQLRDTPLGQFNGLGLHETAALFFEQLAVNEKFWELVTPMIQDHFGVNGPEWSSENLRQIMNSPALDETYWGASELALMPNMYFRSMAERKIMDGELEVKELPKFWAATMETLTGLPHKAENFFVDESHWFDRYTGYFPAYWIGGLCGARLHELVDNKAAASANSLTEYLQPFYQALNEKVFKHGALDKPLDLIKREFGNLPAEFLPTYLRRMTTSYLGRTGSDLASNILARQDRPPDQDRPKSEL